ncbi:MAG: hypothetical protein VB097_07110 [Rikenellaceae bacterium]|nr:hypothetical protein [Rikenellaceae bacterium]
MSKTNKARIPAIKLTIEIFDAIAYVENSVANTSEGKLPGM